MSRDLCSVRNAKPLQGLPQVRERASGQRRVSESTPSDSPRKNDGAHGTSAGADRAARVPQQSCKAKPLVCALYETDNRCGACHRSESALAASGESAGRLPLTAPARTTAHTVPAQVLIALQESRNRAVRRSRWYVLCTKLITAAAPATGPRARYWMAQSKMLTSNGKASKNNGAHGTASHGTVSAGADQQSAEMRESEDSDDSSIAVSGSEDSEEEEGKRAVEEEDKARDQVHAVEEEDKARDQRCVACQI